VREPSRREFFGFAAAFAFLVVINLLIALDGDSPWAWMAVGWSAAFYLTNLVNAVKSNG